MAGKKVPQAKKVPMRQCTGCGERKEKKELLRIIRTAENVVELDDTGKKNGRGAYICNSVNCLALARKRKSLERSLNMEIPAEVYDDLEKEMDKLENG